MVLRLGLGRWRWLWLGLGLGTTAKGHQVASAEALVLLPGVHDGAVVDGDDVHLVDPRLLKLALDLGFLEARDLARGSGGRKCAREGDPERLLALVEVARPGQQREGGVTAGEDECGDDGAGWSCSWGCRSDEWRQ